MSSNKNNLRLSYWQQNVPRRRRCETVTSAVLFWATSGRDKDSVAAHGCAGASGYEAYCPFDGQDSRISHGYIL